MTRWKLLLYGASIWLAACAGGFKLIGLKTDRTEYRPGTTLTLKLRNRSAHAVGYNFCYTRLQRRGASGWESVSLLWGENRVRCFDVQHVLNPWEEVATGAALKADLPAGEYRFVTNVEWNRTRQELASTPFRVVPRTSP